MALNKVEICGVNTSRLPILTNEEKELLFEKIKKGDKEARELYIKGNLRLVLSVIKRFSGSNENADDLFQIGCIGLMKAIDNFDTTLQVKFSTYAVPMIIGEIRRYLRDNSTIRVSRSLRDTAYKAIYARENYLKNNLREPTIMEIASEIGMEKEEIVYALDAIQSPMSLYEPVYTEGGDAPQKKGSGNYNHPYFPSLFPETGSKRTGTGTYLADRQLGGDWYCGFCAATKTSKSGSSLVTACGRTCGSDSD